MEGFYEHPRFKGFWASADAQMWNANTKRFLKGCLNDRGYTSLACMLDGQRFSMERHKFVYECVSGQIVDSRIHDVDHIDGNSLNDAFANLQLLTRAEHCKKTRKSWTTAHAKRKPVVRYKMGPHGRKVDIKRYESLKDAAQDIGGTISNISQAARGHFSTRYGYSWEYVLDEDLPGEVWCSLRDPQFRGASVSNLGRVCGKSGVRSYGHKAKSGYRVVGIGSSNYTVHRLVCLAFHGPPPSSTQVTVDHIDHDRANNRASNLRWASTREQNFYKSAIAVIAYDESGDEVGRWASVTEAANAINGHTTCISKCILGKLNTHRGLRWARL